MALTPQTTTTAWLLAKEAGNAVNADTHQKAMAEHANIRDMIRNLRSVTSAGIEVDRAMISSLEGMLFQLMSNPASVDMIVSSSAYNSAIKASSSNGITMQVGSSDITTERVAEEVEAEKANEAAQKKAHEARVQAAYAAFEDYKQRGVMGYQRGSEIVFIKLTDHLAQAQTQADIYQDPDGKRRGINLTVAEIDAHVNGTDDPAMQAKLEAYVQHVSYTGSGDLGGAQMAAIIARGQEMENQRRDKAAQALGFDSHEAMQAQAKADAAHWHRVRVHDHIRRQDASPALVKAFEQMDAQRAAESAIEATDFASVPTHVKTQAAQAAATVTEDTIVTADASAPVTPTTTPAMVAQSATHHIH